MAMFTLYLECNGADEDAELIAQVLDTLSAIIATTGVAENVERLISDKDGNTIGSCTYRAEENSRIADRIDGYDRDDLGESPDF